jgi:predicted transposase
MEAFNDACNWMAEVAFKEQCANKIELQKLVYFEARDRFGLASQLVIRAISKVVEAYKRDRSIQPSFRRHGAMIYDPRVLSFKGLDHVSLALLSILLWHSNANGRLRESSGHDAAIGASSSSASSSRTRPSWPASPLSPLPRATPRVSASCAGTSTRRIVPIKPLSFVRFPCASTLRLPTTTRLASFGSGPGLPSCSRTGATPPRSRMRPRA